MRITRNELRAVDAADVISSRLGRCGWLCMIQPQHLHSDSALTRQGLARAVRMVVSLVVVRCSVWRYGFSRCTYQLIHPTPSAIMYETGTSDRKLVGPSCLLAPLQSATEVRLVLWQIIYTLLRNNVARRSPCCCLCPVFATVVVTSASGEGAPRCWLCVCHTPTLFTVQQRGALCVSYIHSPLSPKVALLASQCKGGQLSGRSVGTGSSSGYTRYTQRQTSPHVSHSPHIEACSNELGTQTLGNAHSTQYELFTAHSHGWTG